jgi:hypothetical protein
MLLLMYAVMAKVAGQMELELMGVSSGARAAEGGSALTARTAEKHDMSRIDSGGRVIIFVAL